MGQAHTFFFFLMDSHGIILTKMSQFIIIQIFDLDFEPVVSGICSPMLKCGHGFSGRFHGLHAKQMMQNKSMKYKAHCQKLKSVVWCCITKRYYSEVSYKGFLNYVGLIDK